MASKLLTKSKFLNGLQCYKLLWLVFNDPEKVPAPDAATQRIFDQGHLVGDLAQTLFPGGISVPQDNFRENLRLTKKLLAEGKPLFEAGFMAERLFSRIDILQPAGEGQWDIVEVKSTTSVKDENIQDVAFQKLCAERSGASIRKCFLAYINNQYVKRGEIDPGQLFNIEDISEAVEEAGEGIGESIAMMLEIVADPECPEVKLGGQCRNPYDCPVSWCWEEAKENTIFNLYRGGQKCFEMYHAGILDIKDIPEQVKLSRAQGIQKDCEKTGIPHIEREPIQQFLGEIRQPAHYLDFETINPAIPLFDGIRPYQRVPFQFSLHISDGRDGISQESFLAEGAGDPRPRFLERLKGSILPEGSIVTYNQAFEEGVLKELAEAFPEYGEWVEGIRRRLVDLLKPFQGFHYYHPQQKGSASIKSVLPALTGKGYEGMEIHDGDGASRAFMTVTYGEATEEERRRVRADLEKYCGLDTEAMVRIVGVLEKIQ